VDAAINWPEDVLARDLARGDSCFRRVTYQRVALHLRAGVQRLTLSSRDGPVGAIATEDAPEAIPQDVQPGAPFSPELSSFGRVVRHYVHQIPRRFLHLRLVAGDLNGDGVDLVLRSLMPLGGCGPLPPPLASAVHWLKTRTADAYRRGVHTRRWPDAPDGPWQAGFHVWPLRPPRTEDVCTRAVKRLSAKASAKALDPRPDLGGGA
jgi:hypothetical protein